MTGNPRTVAALWTTPSFLRSEASSPTPQFERFTLQRQDAFAGYLDVARFQRGAVLWRHNDRTHSMKAKKIVQVEARPEAGIGEIRPYPSSKPQPFGPGLVIDMPIELAPGAVGKFWPMGCTHPTLGWLGCIGVMDPFGAERTAACCVEMLSVILSWLLTLPSAEAVEPLRCSEEGKDVWRIEALFTLTRPGSSAS